MTGPYSGGVNVSRSSASNIDSVSAWRSQAAERWKTSLPERGLPSPGSVEMVALGLWEAEVWKDPRAALSQVGSSAVPELSKRAQAYARDLSGALGASLGSAPSSLAPALLSALSEVRWELFAHQSGVEVLGTCADHHRVNLATTPTGLADCHLKVTGVQDPRQLANVCSAVAELSSKTSTKAMTVVRSVDLRSSLGTFSDQAPVLGLSGNGRGVSLLSSVAFDLAATRGVLFHEVGHQVDKALAHPGQSFRSTEADTPFGKTTHPEDYPSPQVVGQAAEDFADSHAQLILDWNAIEANPDLLIHARGKVGEKLAWIRDKAYRQPVPPPSERYQAIERQVLAQATPFSDLGNFYDSVNGWLYGREVPADHKAWLETHFSAV